MMARIFVVGELWSRVEPLLPPYRPHKGAAGRDTWTSLSGILLVWRTSVPWQELLQELGCSSLTCWRWLRYWKKAGVWERLRSDVLGVLGQKGWIDWSRAA